MQLKALLARLRPALRPPRLLPVIGTVLVAAAAAAVGLSLYGCQTAPGAGTGPAAAAGSEPRATTPRAPIRGVDAPWLVGLQIGHLDAVNLPPELARLRTSTGAHAAGIAEAEVNHAIASRAAALLEAHAIEVVLLPATIPPLFDADAFIALHADGNTRPDPRGFKVAPPWLASPASRQLAAALQEHYAHATGLPHDLNGVTYNMRGYYAFSSYRYRHAIAPTTPAAILEMGYLSNPADRAFLLEQPELAAQGIAAGVLAFLDRRNPHDRRVLYPANRFVLRPARANVPVFAAPNPLATVRAFVQPTDFVVGHDLVDGWYDVRIRGSWRTFGWVRAADVVPAR